MKGMIEIIRKTIMVAACMALTSCVTRGSGFSSDYSWIKKGQTSQQEVSRRLGDPFLVGYSSGRPTWTYGFYKYRLVGESHTKELTFYWDKAGMVDNFVFKSSFPEDRQKMLSQPKLEQ